MVMDVTLLDGHSRTSVLIACSDDILILEGWDANLRCPDGHLNLIPTEEIAGVVIP
jgi:hypothetical protein